MAQANGTVRNILLTAVVLLVAALQALLLLVVQNLREDIHAVSAQNQDIAKHMNDIDNKVAGILARHDIEDRRLKGTTP